MMNPMWLAAGAALLLGGCACSMCGSGGGGNPPLRHVVLFKFKPEATAEQIAAMERGLDQLAKDVPSIRHLEWGRNISGEQRSHGYTHCLIVTFDDQAGLDAYLPHPGHQAFVQEKLRPIMEDVTVIDFFPQHAAAESQ